MSLFIEIQTVSDEIGIDAETLYNLAVSESGLGRERTGDNGESCGVIHFYKRDYPEEFERCDDDSFILRRAAEMIRDDLAYKFTPCSCVQFAKALGVKIPTRTNAWDFVPNTTLADIQIGDLILFKYSNGQRHVGVFKGFMGGKMIVDQSNYRPCKIERWYLDPADKSIFGYWSSSKI